MEYTKEITLSFTPSGDIPVVRVKQGDSSTRFIRITLLQGDDIFTPGAEQTILFREEKPDGHGILTDSTYYDNSLDRYLVINNGDGTVTVELTAQCTACAGFCKCDLCFVQSEAVISTAPFLLEVEAAPGISDTIVSSDDFRTLINALRDVGLSSTTELEDMTDVELDNVANDNILVYLSSVHKWVNKSIASYGYQTENDVEDKIEGYGYQTESDVNTLIAQYIQNLDGNNVRY